MRLGLFDDGKASDKYFTLGSEAIDSPAHQQLALEAAQQSIVLLKNEGQLLPLQPSSSPKRWPSAVEAFWNRRRQTTISM